MATSARFGRTGLGAGVRFDANNLMRLADRTGRFFGGDFQRALARVHADSARKVSQGMVDELQRKVRETGRTQRGGNRLAVALLDERNIEVTASGFTTLRPYWMNRSPAALYWRRIEEGDAATFAGRVLFTSNFSSYYGPYSPGGGSSTQGRQKSRRRGAPPGYKHMRMPQHKGVLVQQIGPYPAYEYTEGGRRVFRRIDYLAAYRMELAKVGVKMTSAMTR